MSDRSNQIIMLGVAFFFVGAFVVYVVLSLANDNSGRDECWDRGGVAVQSVEQGEVICLDPSALR